jgi:hypothetical protein
VVRLFIIVFADVICVFLFVVLITVALRILVRL